MKPGRPIAEVLAEVQQQAKAKQDYIINTQNQIRMLVAPPPVGINANPEIQLGIKGQQVPFRITEHTHNQIGDRIGIPAKYYDRMRNEAPDLLVQNVNTWFERKPEKRMLRTMTVDRPTARAFLSQGYRRLDNYDLGINILPFMTQEYDKPLQVASCELTEQRFYLKVIAPHTERDLTTLLKPGTHQFIREPVRAGFIVQNSEIGLGAISAFPFTEILRCTNGMIMEEFGTRKYHSGKRNQGDGGDEDAASILSDETKALDDLSFWSRVKDIIRACLQEETYLKVYRKMAEARDLKVEKNPEEAVEILANNYGIGEAQKQTILRTLIDSGQGLTLYGLQNAVTTAAQDKDLGYDESTRLEAVGGRLLNLSPSEWKTIAA